ncbi:viral TNFr II-like protein [White-tailed deer poxvirus]|nr:viral TNFr II-like protein [White-tailed deer poxvirus]
MIKKTFLSFIFFIAYCHASKGSDYEEIPNTFTMFVDLTVYDKNLTQDVSCIRYSYDDFYSMYIVNKFNVSITLSGCDDAGFTEAYYTNVRDYTMELGYFTPADKKYKGLGENKKCVVKVVITCDGEENNLVQTPKNFKYSHPKHKDHKEKLMLYGTCISGVLVDIVYDYGFTRDVSSIQYGTVHRVSGLFPSSCVPR